MSSGYGFGLGVLFSQQEVGMRTLIRYSHQPRRSRQPSSAPPPCSPHNRHTAPIWQISWAHPSFGTLLASCSYDSRVYVWKETSPGSSSSTGAGGGLTGGRNVLGGAGKTGQQPQRQGEWEKIKEVVAHSASGECRFVLGSQFPSIYSISLARFCRVIGVMGITRCLSHTV